MAIRWDLLEAQGIKRSGNRGVGSPFAFVIVGVDIELDDLLAKFDGDTEAQDIIRKGGKDAARLNDEIPGWFRRNLARGKPKAIVAHQLLEKNKRGEVVKSWPIVIDGRSRNVTLRQHITEGQKSGDASKDRLIEAEIKAYNKESGAGAWALREKERANHFIPESLFVKAERAADFAEDGVDLVQIADEIGMDFGDPGTDEGRKAIERGVKALLRWHEIKKDLCVEAQLRANKGDLRLGAAVRLAKLGKAEQKERLEGKRAKVSASTRPLSPRTIDLFAEEIKKSLPKDGDVMVPAGVILRLVNGDRSAAKDLIGTARAAWLKAEEAAKKKPRAK